jgi:aspartate kinase
LISGLFKNPETALSFLDEKIIEIWTKIENYSGEKFDEFYDQIVSFGEIMSTKIISYYLQEINILHKWLDAKKYIKTDSNFREGKVNWDATKSSIEFIDQDFLLYITQGFIGGTSDGKATTLGREGSDYTASIFAHCLDAESVTIWKDVPGVLSADPRLFDDPGKYDHLSYQEAIEMTYYGATVIHPKTIKPLQNSAIPLFVKPFLHPDEPGTVIDEKPFTQTNLPSVIVKKNQVLISISTLDFSFVSEANISDIFEIIAKHNLKCNLSQNSAMSYTVCLDFDEMKFDDLRADLQKRFKILYNTELELITVRHYQSDTMKKLTESRKVFVEQVSRNTAQVVVR